MKKQLGLILLLCMITAIFALPAIAAEEILANGSCGSEGDNVTWVLDNEGVLTISGEGVMEDFSDPTTLSNIAPWYEKSDNINTIIIEHGITSIGTYAFSGCKTVTAIEIPNSVTTIGSYAFYQCEQLASIKLPNGLECISDYMFQQCSALTSINIPDSITTIGTCAFSNCQNLTSIILPKNIKTLANYSFINCTKLKSVYFEGKIAPSMNIYDAFSNASDGLILYYYEGATGWDSIESNNNITIQKLPPRSDYTATLSVSPAATTVAQQILVTVTANQSFTASELVLTYDQNVLTFNKEASTLNGAAVTETNGTLTLADYGDEQISYIFSFTANTTGTTAINLTSAAFSTAADAATDDLKAATIENGTVSITVNPTVTLPSDGSITGSDIAVYGKSYAFSITEYNTNYTYDITAKMNGTNITVIDKGNGNYSIANVTDALVISVTATPKTYTVTFSKEPDMTDLPDTADATYGNSYSIVLPVKDHYSAEVTAYYNTTEHPAVNFGIENGHLTIAGNAITDNIIIEVSWTQTDAKVTVAGSGASDVQNAAVWAVYGEDYTLTVNRDNTYTYTVTATVNGIGVDLTNNGNVYTLSRDNIPAGAMIAITVEKTLAMNISVTEYLTLNGGQKLYLILNTVDKVDGIVYRYEDTAMFWSEKYQAYCTLTVASSAPAADDITLTSSTGSVVEIDYDSLDINKSGKTDANDAQFVYNMYNAMYDGITNTVTIEKYLRADINNSKTVTVDDAAAIVSQLLNSK